MTRSLLLAAVLAAAPLALADATRPTTQPASQPTTQPSTQPSTEPATQPATTQAAATQYGKPITTEITPGKMITYPAELTDVRAYLVTPSTPGPHPAVVFCHDIFGPSTRMKKTADDLARQGYVVIMPDLYTRQAEIKTPDEGLDGKQAWIAYANLQDTQAVGDLKAAISHLIKEKLTGEETPVAVVGEDMGGTYALLLAGQDLRIRGAVNYYGRVLYTGVTRNQPVSPVDALFNLQGPVLSFYGDLDPQVPAEHVKALRNRLRNTPNKVPFDIVTYPDVGHSFLNESRKGYNKQAAEDARTRTRDFLARILRAEPEKLDE